MALTKFKIPPESSSYSVADGSEVVSVQLDGGLSRRRRDIIGASSKVDVSWILTQDGFAYLRSFFRGITGKGALPFLIDLILDDYELTEHTASFVEGSLKLTAQKGHTYWASAQLEVTPNEDTDQGSFAELYNNMGESWFRYLDKLNTIVNVYLAESMEI